MDQHLSPVWGSPPKRVARRPSFATQAAPEDDQGKAEPRGQRGERRGVSERIGRVEHARSVSAKPLEHSSPGKEVPNQCLARGDELVGQDVPRTGLQRARAEPLGERVTPLGSNGKVVVDDYCLTVQQKARTGLGSLGEQLIDQRDEPLTETTSGKIPLAVPVCVCDDVNVQRRDICHTRHPQKQRGGLAAAYASCPWSDPSSPRDEAIDDHHDGDHEQQVEQPSRHVEH